VNRKLNALLTQQEQRQNSTLLMASVVNVSLI
jgi:hypothetical protein